MSEVNSVELRGQVSIRGSGRSQKDLAWARGSLHVGKQWIPVKAFGEAAEALGNAADLTVTVSGHLEGDPPKDRENKAPWPLVVVVDKVLVHAPGERKGIAPPARPSSQTEDDLPF